MFPFVSYILELKHRFFFILLYFFSVYVIILYTFHDLFFSITLYLYCYMSDFLFQVDYFAGVDFLSAPSFQSYSVVLNNFYSYYFLILYFTILFVPFYLFYQFFLFSTSAMYSYEKKTFFFSFIFKLLLCLLNLFVFLCYLFIIISALLTENYVLSFDLLNRLFFYISIFYIVYTFFLFFSNFQFRMVYYFSVIFLTFFFSSFYFHVLYLLILFVSLFVFEFVYFLFLFIKNILVV